MTWGEWGFVQKGRWEEENNKIRAHHQRDVGVLDGVAEPKLPALVAAGDVEVAAISDHDGVVLAGGHRQHTLVVRQHKLLGREDGGATLQAQAAAAAMAANKEAAAGGEQRRVELGRRHVADLGVGRQPQPLRFAAALAVGHAQRKVRVGAPAAQLRQPFRMCGQLLQELDGGMAVRGQGHGAARGGVGVVAHEVQRRQALPVARLDQSGAGVQQLQRAGQVAVIHTTMQGCPAALAVARLQVRLARLEQRSYHGAVAA